MRRHHPPFFAPLCPSIVAVSIDESDVFAPNGAPRRAGLTMPELAAEERDQAQRDKARVQELESRLEVALKRSPNANGSTQPDGNGRPHDN